MGNTPTFSVDKAADLLALMGHEGRLRVLSLIMQNEWDVNSLAAEVNLSQSALSQHLKKLRDAHIVNVRRNAQTMYYSCKSEAVAKVMSALMEIHCQPEEKKKSAA